MANRPKHPPRIKVHWWEDTCGRLTCHRNVERLSFRESLLGGLKEKPDGWYYWLEDGSSDPPFRGPFRHVQVARRALEDAVGGEQIDPWD